MKWRWPVLFFGGGYALTQYRFEDRATAVFEHVDKPFTQGLVAHPTGACASTGQELDGCYGNSTRSRLVDCYVKTLQRCVKLYESSGLYGQSYVQKVLDFGHGQPAYRTSLPHRLFAEGMDVLEDGRLAVATWKERRLLIFEDDGHGLRLSEELFVQQPAEHWGLATNGATKMWLTSGGSILSEFDLPLKKTPSVATGLSEALRNRRIPSIKPDRSVRLTCAGQSIPYVNELAWDNETDTLWGNVWMSDRIYQFDHRNGECLGVLDVHSDLRLAEEQKRNRDVDAVWNGIAFLGNNWILFTGKRFRFYYLSKITTV